MPSASAALLLRASVLCTVYTTTTAAAVVLVEMFSGDYPRVTPGSVTRLYPVWPALIGVRFGRDRR